MTRIKVDIHPIYSNSAAVDGALQQAYTDAVENDKEGGDNTR